MMHTKAIAILFLAGQILCQSQSDKTQQSSIADFDPQILNHQLQQLALQQYSGQQYASQSSQYARQSQAPQYDAQSLQYGAAGQQYDAQSVQQQGTQTQQLTQQDYDAARILQAKLFEPYQGQFGGIQAQAGQYSSQQLAPVAPQPSSQQLSKQSLLGVAYSSAADASKTSFTGYGIKYSF